MHRGLENSRVQLRDDLIGFYECVVIGKELLDITGDLAADLDVDYRVERPAGSHDLGQVPTGDLGSLVLRRVVVVGFEIPEHAAEYASEQDDDYEPFDSAGFCIFWHS